MAQTGLQFLGNHNSAGTAGTTTSGNCTISPIFLSETGSHTAQDGSNYGPTPLTPALYYLSTGFLATLLWSPLFRIACEAVSRSIFNPSRPF